MKWVEIIELRSTKEEGALLEKDLEDFVDALKCEESPLEVNVLGHGSLEFDFLQFESAITIFDIWKDLFPYLATQIVVIGNSIKEFL